MVNGYLAGLKNIEKFDLPFFDSDDGPKSEPKYLVDVLVNSSPKKDGDSRDKAVDPAPIDEPGEPVVAGVPLSQVLPTFLSLTFRIQAFVFWQGPDVLCC